MFNDQRVHSRCQIDTRDHVNALMFEYLMRFSSFFCYWLKSQRIPNWCF